MGSISRTNLSDQILELISKKIIRQEIKPGETIYESQLSRDLGVSRSPVRDALHFLEQIWLVERTPKGGYQVSELDPEKIRHLFETAIVLYQYAFAKAAERAAPADHEALERLMREMEAGCETDNIELYIATVTRMANKILEIAGNPMIARIARELMPMAERIQWASITLSPGQLKTAVGHIRRGLHHIYGKQPTEAASAFQDFAAANIEAVMGGLGPSFTQQPSS